MGRLSRRMFGRLVAGAAVGLAGGWRLRFAEAATPAVARRLVVFFSPNGTVHSHWRPAGSGTGFSFPAGSILEPLSPHRTGLVVVDGLVFENTSNHEGGMRAMLTGNGAAGHTGGGASVDQYVAGQIGGGLPFPSLELGVHTSAWGAGVQTRMSYSAPGTFVPPDDDPGHVWSRLVEKLAPESALPTKQDLRRQKALDLVHGELQSLTGKVGAEDRQRIEQHLGAVQQVQASLAASGLCGTAGAEPDVDPTSNDAFPQVLDAQIRLLTTALSCGMTRVASLQCSHTVGPPVFTWLGLTEGHHSLSHKGDSDAAGVAQFVLAERWIASKFAALLDSLAAAPDLEYGGTLLDHTLVVWCKEMGDGRMHDCLSVPFVLGGVPALLGPGRLHHTAGAPHQQLLVSICHLLGLGNMTFGDPSYGTGPLPGLLA